MFDVKLDASDEDVARKVLEELTIAFLSPLGTNDSFVIVSFPTRSDSAAFTSELKDRGVDFKPLL